MEFREFTAGIDDNGRRLDRVLKSVLKGNPDVNIFSALRKKLITVNSCKKDASYRIRLGDKIKIAAFLLIAPSEDSIEHNLKINVQDITLFKNDSILVVNKPYGVSVQPSASQKECLATFFARELKKTESLSFTPSPLHRLDRFTTGALAVSLSIDGAREFSRMIKERLIKKTYLGIVSGALEKSVVWEDCIDRSAFPEKNQSSFYTVSIAEGIESNCAVTKAAPVACGSYGGTKVSLVRFEIPTGKKHQIRAQSAFHGFPLLGDTAYGSSPLKERKFFLHAFRMEFREKNSLFLPDVIEAPLPAEFENFLNSALIKWDGKLII